MTMSIGMTLLLAWSAGTAAQLTSDERQTLLTQHNIFRCMSKVPLLVWDDSLAASAQAYANLGQFKHSADALAGKVGENIAYRYPVEAATPQQAVIDWYAEIKTTNPYGTATAFSQSTGHYTAMMWKATTRVGCGAAAPMVAPDGSGNMARFWVCQYMSVPNVRGQFHTMILAPTVSPDKCGGTQNDVPTNFPTLTGTPDADKNPGSQAPATVDDGLAIAPAPAAAYPAPAPVDDALAIAPAPAAAYPAPAPVDDGLAIAPAPAPTQTAGNGVLPGQGLQPAASMPNEVAVANRLENAKAFDLLNKSKVEGAVPFWFSTSSLLGTTMIALILVVSVVGMIHRRGQATMNPLEESLDEARSLNEL